jgi:hypothetical protein
MPQVGVGQIADVPPAATSPDWGLVLASGAAALGVVTLFWLAVWGMGSASSASRKG